MPHASKTAACCLAFCLLFAVGCGGGSRRNPGGFVPSPSKPPPGFPEPRDVPVDPQLVAEVTAWCAARGVLAEDLRGRTLEDVFLELTGRELRA